LKWLLVYEYYPAGFGSFRKDYKICLSRDDVTYQKNNLPTNAFFIEAFEITGSKLKNETVTKLVETNV
jgi:hypothetical protein